ncbi:MULTISPECIES: DUF2917 domain-containing protein [unclassified Polaromonas]|jgi:hypothetical protein|uniref:DUF2917 domain-containing protein n=1 Tax=unclassified Polaromonas TaxID=2638319 RepID=UPI000BC5580E|nr:MULTISPECIES: DUF2917 domain-containing protein [unclassified Polaromonas]OYY35069.1 MAG: hypothetical protein B7Y60_14450 [Polaromonas sp. 35-63-35]OYZ20208.1 MAG: hypothetical protein B7Y28_09820 [Polaromonas sp. 16-63-31]OYZ77963.1 MAG: hypothetical protein B7Y09_14645 [Polaromonas sp. 24-63-21]OZA49473.1 MAG: hypothetical protein B7X88_13660 [Polaromonas sp. 17-63-33]OZA87394.1 MAG: hypothetical protein B7X65_12810 [Polaromonas sp. 39-63-25]
MSTAFTFSRLFPYRPAWPWQREGVAWPGSTDTLDLSKSAIHRIARPAGYRIECIAGSAWVTQDGHARDIMLEAGEGYTCVRPERLLVQALEAVVLRVALAAV